MNFEVETEIGVMCASDTYLLFKIKKRIKIRFTKIFQMGNKAKLKK